MKKIGILTFSYGSNYGGTLQCVGLFKFLKEQNFDVKVINYLKNDTYSFKSKYLIGAITKKDIKNNLKNFKETSRKLFIKFRYVDSILKKFDLFRKKNLILTNTGDSVRKIIELHLNNNLDYIIVGSDQVWSNVSEYFLNEINDKNIKKISYAACSGKKYEYGDKKEYLVESLKKFRKISVRNKHTQQMVEELIGFTPSIVCDPSVLWDYKEFLKKDFKKEKYILTYILGSDIKEGNEKVIKEIKKIYGDIKVIAIGIPFVWSGSLRFYPWADEVLYDASPEDWLNLINNAEFIYTDSYHGILFSMKFHKQFLGYYTEKVRAPRLMDLAKRYKVEKNIVNTLEEAIEKKSISEKINYEEIDLLIEEHRKYSIDFLKKALED